MKRNQFIKSLGLGITGVLVLPQFSFNTLQDEYTLNNLIGKGNKRLVGTNHQMIDTAYEAFQEMKKEALKSAIQLEAVSAYRNFNRQKQIWNRKYNRFAQQGISPEAAIKKIVEYSSIPSTSRHHWGTEIDLIDSNIKNRPANVLNEKHFHGEGVFCKMKEWMNTNSEKFGFYEVYTNNFHRKGFKYEPWHFSYKPVSKPMLKAYQNINIKSLIQNLDIQGKEHFTTSFAKDYIKNQILDINPTLLP